MNGDISTFVTIKYYFHLVPRKFEAINALETPIWDQNAPKYPFWAKNGRVRRKYIRDRIDMNSVDDIE